MKKITNLSSFYRRLRAKIITATFGPTLTPGLSRDAKSYHEQGVSQARQGNFEEAIQFFDKAISLNPALYMAWIDRGRIFLELERYNEAQENFNQAIKLDSRCHEGWQLRGSAKYYLGDYSGALADYNKSVALTPNDSPVYFTGEALNKTYAVCPGYKNMNPTFAGMQDADSYYNQGYQKELEEKFEEAIKLFDKAIALQPDFFKAHFEKGYCKGMLRYLKPAPRMMTA